LDIVIAPVDVDEVIVSGLVAALDADLMRRYPGESTNGVDAREFREAGGYFLLARRGSEAVGCGAFRPIDARTVEIKRMFVDPRCRGRGIARAVLDGLEAEARRRGYVRSILETGVRQPEAIALYRSVGYVPIAPFGPYVESPLSVCFGKDLAPADRAPTDPRGRCGLAAVTSKAVDGPRRTPYSSCPSEVR
jgi:putative acetyltransferase